MQVPSRWKERQWLSLMNCHDQDTTVEAECEGVVTKKR